MQRVCRKVAWTEVSRMPPAISSGFNLVYIRLFCLCRLFSPIVGLLSMPPALLSGLRSSARSRVNKSECTHSTTTRDTPLQVIQVKIDETTAAGARDRDTPARGSRGSDAQDVPQSGTSDARSHSDSAGMDPASVAERTRRIAAGDSDRPPSSPPGRGINQVAAAF